MLFHPITQLCSKIFDAITQLHGRSAIHLAPSSHICSMNHHMIYAGCVRVVVCLAANLKGQKGCEHSFYNRKIFPAFSKDTLRLSRDMAGTGSPLSVFEDASARFKKAISPSDFSIFESTTLEDVSKTLLAIQDQSKRKSLRNMVRIGPLIYFFEEYSRVAEVMCNGTPYLPSIWVSWFAFLYRNDTLNHVLTIHRPQSC